MGKKSLLIRLFALVAAMMCALGIHAQEAYACYTSSNTTLTFYYDTQRSSRPGTTYDLNTGTNFPDWDINVTKVFFDPSFADARPTTTFFWFSDMVNLQSITDVNYLNTSEVTNMEYMFFDCNQLTSIDVSNFNTSKVTNMCGMFVNCIGLTSLDLSSFNTSKITDMEAMFYGCRNLRTIYVGNAWTTNAVTKSPNMFYCCTNLVGGQGTTYDASNPTDKTYAHIDGGPSNPGYFTDKNASIGDVTGEGDVDVSDVNAVINIILHKKTEADYPGNADITGEGNIDVSDVNAIINIILHKN
ncbi:MAG: BspA family leucine-rich repeat surface protein [Muribaculaceae bacterium]|nr:BspA family leucine-rich repeat surface protein [Muribaculaceae bacterium]